MNKKSGSDSISSSPLAKKVTRQTQGPAFHQTWLENPAFKCWLQHVQDHPYKAKCTICCKYIPASKSNLQYHAKSEEHIMNMEHGKEPPLIDEATSTNVATDSSSDSICSGPPAKKVKREKQVFCQTWLEDPALKPWLQQVQDDPYKGKCTICFKYIAASKSNLLHHANCEEHIKNMNFRKESLIQISTSEAAKNFSDDVKVAEIRVCINAIENNRSFNSFMQFIRMQQKTLPDGNLIKHMSLSSNKMSAIAKNVISKSIIAKNIEKLEGNFFSVFIDEIADIADTKMVIFLIRYVHNGQIYTDLLDLIRIKDCTAENLYQCLRHSLNKYNLRITNMVGVCMDKAKVGEHNSLTARLLADNGEICALPCTCHSIDLAARKACECLPRYVEKFLQSLYSYVSRNPKQLSMLKGTQQFLKVAGRKVTQPSAIKWLAQSACIKSVLNQWTVLFNVFAEASSERNADAAKRIFSSFNCLYTKAYLQFMNYILVIFTELYQLLRSSKVLVHRLLPECHRLLKTLGGNFIESKYLEQPNMHKINVNNDDNLLPLTKIFTGAGCMTTLSEIANGNLEENGDMIQFYVNIKKCYQSAFQNIVNTVPFDDTFLNALDFLNPKTALDKHQQGQLDCILNKFRSKFDYELVVNEWHLLPFIFSDKAIEKLEVMSLPQFWHEMSITTNAEDECILLNISKLAQLCLSLPHSNADVERYFSTVTQIKTNERNRLNPETVAAIVRIKQDLKSKNEHWHDYKITDDMLNLFNNNMYNKEIIPKKLGGILLPTEMYVCISYSDNN